MNRKKPYSPVNVKDVVLSALLEQHAGPAVWVGIDVSKEHLLVAPCWGRGEFSRPWRVRFPEQLPVLMELIKQLAGQRRLMVALEPTGTYGDPLRWALTKAKLDVQRVECKASHDHAEVFDKVPSQHDAKDAMVIADLARDGKSTPWPLSCPDERESQMRCLVKVADDQQKVHSTWCGCLESLLARHWPEATRVLDLSSSTLLHVLIEYGGPAGLAEDGEAEQRLRGWGGAWLSDEKIAALIASARTTIGVPANLAETQRIRQCAQKALEASRELEASKKELAGFVKGDADLERVAEQLGAATTCVLWVMLGHPRNYSSARAYLKAAGLNLAERSSGKYQGELKISKRGPSVVRRWLYLAAVRLLQKPEAAAWYSHKRQRDESRRARGPRRKGKGLIGLVALMRRLLGAVWHVTRKREAFAVWRLFAQPAAAGKRRPGAAGRSAEPAAIER